MSAPQSGQLGASACGLKVIACRPAVSSAVPLVKPIGFGPAWARASGAAARAALTVPGGGGASRSIRPTAARASPERDRKSTRLNSSHITISYAVFCLKKKKKKRHKYINNQT